MQQHGPLLQFVDQVSSQHHLVIQFEGLNSSKLLHCFGLNHKMWIVKHNSVNIRYDQLSFNLFIIDQFCWKY